MGMDVTQVVELESAETCPDEEVVRRVREGDPALFELLMRRHNRRLYRVARSVLKDESEVEDVMQQAYISAFSHLHQFAGRSKFSTWITRIALNEAFERRRKAQQAAVVRAFDGGDGPEPVMDTIQSTQPDPERRAYAGELRRVLEQAIDALPDAYRTVIMLRDVEGLSTDETGTALGLGEEAVKTRLHRARAMVRRSVTARLGAAARTAFDFGATRCDRVVAAVLAKILASSPQDTTTGR